MPNNVDTPACGDRHRRVVHALGTETNLKSARALAPQVRRSSCCSPCILQLIAGARSKLQHDTHIEALLLRHVLEEVEVIQLGGLFGVRLASH